MGTAGALVRKLTSNGQMISLIRSRATFSEAWMSKKELLGERTTKSRQIN